VCVCVAVCDYTDTDRGCTCSTPQVLLGRGGCHHRRQSLVNCDHGGSILATRRRRYKRDTASQTADAAAAAAAAADVEAHVIYPAERYARAALAVGRRFELVCARPKPEALPCSTILYYTPTPRHNEYPDGILTCLRFPYVFESWYA
jgi:hypothetical protein